MSPINLHERKFVLSRQILLSGLEPTYDVIIHQDVGGTITATPNKNVRQGTRVSIHGTPSSSSYRLNSIGAAPNVSISRSGNDYSFTMPNSDVILTPSWQRLYNVYTNAGSGGSLSCSPNRNVEPGTLVNVTASAYSNYVLESITSSDAMLSGSGNTRSFIMPSKDVTISASFKFNLTSGIILNIFNEFGTYSATIDGRSTTGGHIPNARVGSTVSVTAYDEYRLHPTRDMIAWHVYGDKAGYITNNGSETVTFTVRVVPDIISVERS